MWPSLLAPARPSCARTPDGRNSLHKYSQMAILVVVRVAFYEATSGRSPLEDFIKDLPKADQARFADVFDGIEKYGLGYPRVQFRQLRGKLWEVKFNTPSGGYRIAYI